MADPTFCTGHDDFRLLDKEQYEAATRMRLEIWMRPYSVDMSDASTISALASRVIGDFPLLNGVFQIAGIMKTENVLHQQSDLADANGTVNTNLLGPIRLRAALLPTLLKQPNRVILTVSSGLAFVPMATTPTYSATKAAIYAYSEPLRYQLRQTSVEVIELIPPMVATNPQEAGQAHDPRAMFRDEFISETMRLLLQNPTPAEINLKNILPLSFQPRKARKNIEQSSKK